ncbi:MAG: type I DNA topoisomerase [Chitinophagales bacterium]
MAKKLLIVESPSKAKTIQKYLGNDYVIESSYGHVRDLPKKDISIDVENDFKPNYTISADKKDVVNKLKKIAKQVEEVLLATDEDREGEAISWHLCEILGLDPATAKRVTYTEVTKSAILKAIDNPRKLKMGLVNAQQARRVVDRLVGYELSPVLWRKVKPSLSAGRVQSVSVRLIVEREREIMNFDSTSFYKVVALFDVQDARGKKVILKSELGKKLKTIVEAETFLKAAQESVFSILNITKKPAKRNPAPPFTTSTLQQEASRKLSFSVAKTMQVAQKLYEAGHITYMRTDSVSLSKTAIDGAAAEIKSAYGEEYSNTRHFKTKNKDAQEAHEAIRPTNFANHEAGNNFDESRLYQLIWKRAIASQMSAAELERTIVDIDVSKADDDLKAKGEVLIFDGFLKVYLEGKDEEDEDDDVAGMLPPLSKGQLLDLNKMTATERFTKASARYTEASLVKKMEELGIGRPSTYAPTISTIQKRNYVLKESRDGKERKYNLLTLANQSISNTVSTEITGAEKMKLFPTDIGMVVNDFLVEHFGGIMNYAFTADMEAQFDEIEKGKVEWTSLVGDFYNPFHNTVEQTLETAERATGERSLGNDPETGEPIIARMGKYGPMVQMGVADEETGKKPKFAKLLAHQHIETITLEESLELFILPRELGEYDGEMVKASIGRFGPYVQHGKKFISIPDSSGFNVYEIKQVQAIELIEEKRKADAPVGEYEGFPIQKGVGRFGPFLKWNSIFINVNKRYDFDNLSMADMEELIEEKKQKERDKLIHDFVEVGIRVEKARWGRFHVKKGKIKVELPKTTEIEKMTQEEAVKLIEAKTPKKKAKAKAKKK